MSLSLRDQLLQAGLIDEKQVKAASQQHRQQARRQPDAAAAQKRAAEAAYAKQVADKAARDAELNRQRLEKAERKARIAQVKQLIEQNRLPKIAAGADGEEFYNFIDGKRVRRIGVDAATRKRLIAGALTIVRCEGRYEMVPSMIAERIRERDAHAVIPPNASADATPDADDPYKDFVVPDDLKW